MRTPRLIINIKKHWTNFPDTSKFDDIHVPSKIMKLNDLNQIE